MLWEKPPSNLDCDRARLVVPAQAAICRQLKMLVKLHKSARLTGGKTFVFRHSSE